VSLLARRAVTRVLAAACGAACLPWPGASPAPNPIPIEALATGPSGETLEFFLRFEPAECRVRWNGAGHCALATGPLRFAVPVPDDQWIERLYYFPYQGDFVVLHQHRGWAAAQGAVARLTRRGLRVRWQVSVPAGDLGPPRVHEGFAYVSASGFAGKLDLATGTWAWAHADLHGRDGGPFQASAPASVRRGVATFPARAEPSEAGGSGPGFALRFRDRDGKPLGD
jgi:hypothetical protein